MAASLPEYGYMKTILCYGDSNTWGWDPIKGARLDHVSRWPMVLKKLLNRDCPADEDLFWVVEEGLCGRTISHEDPIEGDKNGLRQLIPIIESHMPLDMVIVFLGTNDLKQRFSPSAFDLAMGIKRMITALQDSRTGPAGSPPEIVVVCPPPTVDSAGYRERFYDMFGDSLKISEQFPKYFRQAADECGVYWLDAGTVIKTSAVDGIHLEAEEHRKLAETLAKLVKEILGSNKPKLKKI
jgi:lysophospholipase L1-like esterase